MRLARRRRLVAGRAPLPSAGSAGIRRMDDLRDALALMPDAALVAGPGGTVELANDPAAELFGPSALVGGRCAAATHGLAAGPGWQRGQARRANGTPVPVEDARASWTAATLRHRASAARPRTRGRGAALLRRRVRPLADRDGAVQHGRRVRPRQRGAVRAARPQRRGPARPPRPGAHAPRGPPVRPRRGVGDPRGPGGHPPDREALRAPGRLGRVGAGQPDLPARRGRAPR